MVVRSARNNLPKRLQRRIAAATVNLPTKNGQGVLVPGGFVLTAAHCVTWTAEGGMALGDHALEAVRTASGDAFRAEVVAVEPVADIAVLAQPDDQVFVTDSDAFAGWYESTQPVAVSFETPKANTSRPVFIYSHHGTWIAATVRRYGMPGAPTSGRVFIEATQQIEGGTSGGPVVDIEGRLVGVVSFSNELDEDPDEPCTGMLPLVHLALPAWVLGRIKSATK